MTLDEYLSRYFKDKTDDEYICIATAQREHGYFNTVAEAIRFAKVKNRTQDIYYALSTFKTEPPDNTRQQDNVHTPFNCCVLDFDFKDQSHLQHKTPEEFSKFLIRYLINCHRTALSWVVDTGGGVHAYFQCDSYDTAMQLRAAMHARYNDSENGRPLIDSKPAKASNSIMRVPASKNHKRGVPSRYKFRDSIVITSDVEQVKGCKAQPAIPVKVRGLPSHIVLNRNVGSESYRQVPVSSFTTPYDALVKTCGAFKAFEDDQADAGHHENICYIQSLKMLRGIDTYQHGLDLYKSSEHYTNDSYYDNQYKSIDRLFTCRDGWQQSSYNEHCRQCKFKDAATNPILAANTELTAGSFSRPPPPPPSNKAALAASPPNEIQFPNKNNPLQWFKIVGNNIHVCTATDDQILATASKDIRFHYEHTRAPANQVDEWPHVVFRVGKDIYPIPIPAGNATGVTQLQTFFDISRLTIDMVDGKGKTRKAPYKMACRDFLDSARTIAGVELTKTIGWQDDGNFAGPWGVIDTHGQLHNEIIPDISLAYQHGDITQADQWWDAITPYMLTVPEMWPHAQMLMHSFAAPLMKLFPYAQTVMSLYGTGNLGKTRTLNICKSVWGRYGSINAADTNNAAFHTLGSTYDFYAAMDDYKSNVSNNQRHYNNTGVDAGVLIHRFTDGAGRSRLHRSGKKLIEVDKFRGNLGVTTNISLKQDFHTQRGASGAEAASKRVVELEVYDVGQQFNAQSPNTIVECGDRAVHAAAKYAGAAGVEYMQYIAANQNKVANLVEQASNRLANVSQVAGYERFYTSFYLSILCAKRILQEMGRVSPNNQVLQKAAPPTSRIDRHIQHQMQHTKQAALHTLPSLEFILGQRALSVFPQVSSSNNLQGWTLINSRSFQSQMTAANAIYIARRHVPSVDPVIAAAAKNQNIKHDWPMRPFNLKRYESESSYVAMFTKDALQRICKEENISDVNLLIKHWRLKTAKLSMQQALPDHHDMPTYKGVIYWTQQR